MKTKKGKVQHKKRVRFCTLDYYRTLCTGKCSDIEGIDNYTTTESLITVNYQSGLSRMYIVNEGENQLKEAVKLINKYLGGH